MAASGPEVMCARSARTPASSMVPMTSATATEIDVMVTL
jgi:hypothetical protein